MTGAAVSVVEVAALVVAEFVPSVIPVPAVYCTVVVVREVLFAGAPVTVICTSVVENVPELTTRVCGLVGKDHSLGVNVEDEISSE